MPTLLGTTATMSGSILMRIRMHQAALLEMAPARPSGQAGASGMTALPTIRGLPVDFHWDFQVFSVKFFSFSGKSFPFQ